jgi:hypothetical protein
MFRSLFLLFAMLSIAPSVHAGDTINTPFLALSEGATTCGEYIAQPTARVSRMEWVMGYISGRNREAASPRERNIGTSYYKAETIDGWLLSYCQTHSLDVLVKAADDLRAAFQRREQGR